jgi:hypothetical protein
MISFPCPQCDTPLQAELNRVREPYQCSGCRGWCAAPHKNGQPAKVLYTAIKLDIPQPPDQADSLPPICICCGRDAIEEPLKVSVWTHPQDLGSKVTRVVGQTFGYWLLSPLGVVGFVVASAWERANEPFELFESVPTCGRCTARDTHRLRLFDRKGDMMTVQGIPTRMAAVIHAARARAEQKRDSEHVKFFELVSPQAGPEPAQLPDGVEFIQ